MIMIDERAIGKQAEKREKEREGARLQSLSSSHNKGKSPVSFLVVF